MAEHSTLTGANLHEPKGADTAGASQVYVSNGAGSGVWTATQSIKTPEVINTLIPDISSADTVYVPMPSAGTVTAILCVLEGPITVADATLTVYNSAGLSMGVITVTATGSASGDLDFLVPASNNTVVSTDYIRIVANGASTGAQRVWVSIVIERS